MTKTLMYSELRGLRLRSRGKVRDIYDIDATKMLIVTTDRLSAFDVVLPSPIPGKGAVLTAISNFWFNKTRHIVPNHLTDRPITEVLQDPDDWNQVLGRAVVVKKLKALPVEAIVRGYLIGSGWKDYQMSSSVCGIELPPGLALADKLPEPLYTPSTKAEVGGHDENITFAASAELLGCALAQHVRMISLRLYREAAAYALDRGIIIADTKFEFGLDEDGELVLIDEVLTPDSSRFWPADAHRPGINPPSFDKQYVRDYLESIGWDKRAPAPALPPEVVSQTVEKYREACNRLTGEV
jgi:phosphoribosylaminoimidazole-succinocarboxamide synthase